MLVTNVLLKTNTYVFVVCLNRENVIFYICLFIFCEIYDVVTFTRSYWKGQTEASSEIKKKKKEHLVRNEKRIIQEIKGSQLSAFCP